MFLVMPIAETPAEERLCKTLTQDKVLKKELAVEG